MTEAVLAQAARTHVEHGDPSGDERAFRRCLGQFATGVAVITATHDGNLVGMAVNSFAAVSLDPPIVLWSIRRESASLSAFLNASHFAVNILAADQVGISQTFGSAHPDRFNTATWTANQHGAPLLDGVIAHLECPREAVHEAGDHLILMGLVESYTRFEGSPLLFAQGQYGVTQSHPQLRVSAALPSGSAKQEVDPALFTTLLKRTSQHMSTLFEEHRQALGVTVESGRVLNRLAVGTCAVDSLELDTYLGPETIADTLVDLIARGQVEHDRDTRYRLTASGAEVREALAQSAERFTGDCLAGITEADIATTKNVLLALLQK